MYRVIIVEDDNGIAEGICNCLAGWGMEARKITDFRRVTEEIEEYKPHLVIMDITMPNMDGLEALKAIRAKDSSANVVMCSAMGQETMVMDAVRSGAKDFIVKPFKGERVIKTVTSILGEP